MSFHFIALFCLISIAAVYANTPPQITLQPKDEIGKILIAQFMPTPAQITLQTKDEIGKILIVAVYANLLLPLLHCISGVDGGVVSFFCKASGSPPPYFSWRKNGKKVRNNRYMTQGMKDGSVFRIEPLRIGRDEANYECKSVFWDAFGGYEKQVRFEQRCVQ